MPPYTYENATTIETQREAALRRTAMLDYWLHIIGAIFSMGVLSLLALIINYIQRPSARGSIYESHFIWMIRSFWKSFLWACILGVLGVLIFGVPGFFICLLSLVWFERQMIRGLQRAKANQPMPS